MLVLKGPELNEMASSTVTISSDQQPKSSPPQIEFDPSYAKSFNGILKIAQVVLSLIGFICVQSVPHAVIYSAVGWYSFVSMTAFWVTLVLLFFYLFHIIERLSMIPWLLGEMGYTAIWCILYFIAATVSASKGGSDAAFGAGAFFGFAAMGVFGVDAFKKYQEWRSGASQSASNEQTSNAPAASPQTPSYPAY